MRRFNVIAGIMLISSFIFVQESAFSQDNAQSDRADVVKELTKDEPAQGTVHMYHDKEIDELITLSKEVLKQNGSVGYTVQLFRGNNGQVSRRNAEQIKSEYLKKDPQGQISVIYTNPNWRVQVGQFRTYAEALKQKMYIEKNMPEYNKQIYIVRVNLSW